MGKMKFMFPNAQGIWLHDTPGKGEDRGGREAAEQRLRPTRGCASFSSLAIQRPAAEPQRARDLSRRSTLPAPVPVYLTYLTAVPSGTSIVYFDDFYGKDRISPATVAPRPVRDRLSPSK
jgi:murein L,D-transpeptidase YcbB/YkuD